MSKLFDGSGNAVEAFTKEEVEAQIAEHPTVKEATTKLADAQTALATANKQIEEFKGSDKGQNFAALREAKEAAEKKVDELKTTVMGEIGTIKKQLDNAELEKTFIAIAGGDIDLAKKVQAEYEKMVKPEDTEEVKREKMGNAYKLAAGYTASPSVLGRVLGSSGAPAGGGGTPAFKPELVEFGKRFGLTAEDFQKYGKK